MNKAQALAAFVQATGTDLFDPEWNGGEWMVSAVETQETLAQFEESSAGWNEKSGFQRGTIGGLNFVAWRSAQPRKGDTRRSVMVIDFIECRICIDADHYFVECQYAK